ncbi:hypothetical protein H6G89_14620 [Oscillatoria sp. FACHB-1407]|uniref:ribbon-helix-helix domain-containing protein n=1 Tax=Oscillatoria sp. FACHB-1407 TaxID=2692847 RepID=UPI001687C31A|nr:hypothetical protein [Oscillatoria sp. FACHB-1407]MBD2462279.1 hypothetical protein [Oscillatoria sp. FACHB-1407]
MSYSATRVFLGKIQMQDLAVDVARKDERVTVPFDRETLERVEAMADQEERPVARQITLLVKAALELIDHQGFKLVDGKLRKVSIESVDIDSEE